MEEDRLSLWEQGCGRCNMTVMRCVPRIWRHAAECGLHIVSKGVGEDRDRSCVVVVTGKTGVGEGR